MSRAVIPDDLRNAVLATKLQGNIEKLDALDRYHDSPLFSEAERIALDYVAEPIRDMKVQPATFARLSCFYTGGQSAKSSGWWPGNTSTTSPASA